MSKIAKKNLNILKRLFFTFVVVVARSDWGKGEGSIVTAILYNFKSIWDYSYITEIKIRAVRQGKKDIPTHSYSRKVLLLKKLLLLHLYRIGTCEPFYLLLC